jgi:hypothetical protein
MIFRPLTTNERAETPGFTHIGVITANDLTTTTVTVVQTLTGFAVVAGDQVMRVAWYLRVPFENTADGTNNTTTVSVGDSTVTTHLAAAEANVNGTEIIWRAGNTAVLYTAGNTFTVTFTPKTGTAISVINKGELHIFVALSRLKYVSDAVAATGMTK